MTAKLPNGVIEIFVHVENLSGRLQIFVPNGTFGLAQGLCDSYTQWGKTVPIKDCLFLLVEPSEYDVLLRAWMHMMEASDISPAGIARLRTAYANDVGVIPPDQTASIIEAGGFEPPVRFFQAGLIHGWVSKRR